MSNLSKIHDEILNLPKSYEETDFEIYRAKHLDKLKYEQIYDPAMKKFYDFLLNFMYYEVYKFAQKAHSKFFWFFNDEETDYEHLKTQANFWGIPFFSFEKFEKHAGAYLRVITALDTIWLKGTKKQVEDMLNIIFGEGNWRHTTYSTNLKISLDALNLTEEKKNNAWEYLDFAIPPYVELEINKYLLPNFDERYTYEKLCERGGGKFIMSRINSENNKYLRNAIVLPCESFRLDTSKLDKDLIKITTDAKDNGIKTIILFKEKSITNDTINAIVGLFFIKDTAKIYVFEEDLQIESKK